MFILELFVKMVYIEDQLSTLIKEVQDQKSQTHTGEDNAPTEWMLTNMNDQLSNLTKVISTISSDLTSVVDRQIKLEQTWHNTERMISRPCPHCQEEAKQRRNTKKHKYTRYGVQTPIPSQSQKSVVTVPDPLTAVTTFGPITRARSKRLREEVETTFATEIRKSSVIPKQSAVKQLSRYNRTLIPWEDIDNEVD